MSSDKTAPYAPSRAADDLPPKPRGKAALAPGVGAQAPPPIARPTRLGSNVYDYVLQQLMSLAIAPDERIGVDQLARELDVSQSPIREALSQLEAQGLVVKTHLRGYRAAPQLSLSQFNDLTELRLLLEPVAVAKVAAQRDENVHKQIAALANTMKKSAANESREAYSSFAQQDAAFHGSIAAACGNALIHHILMERRTHLHLFRLRFYAQVTHEAVREHAAIVNALQAHDPGAAAAAMRRHIERAHQRFIKSYE
jgi:DNA-binding GntR family transcriptional regulator